MRYAEDSADMVFGASVGTLFGAFFGVWAMMAVIAGLIALAGYSLWDEKRTARENAKVQYGQSVWQMCRTW